MRAALLCLLLMGCAADGSYDSSELSEFAAIMLLGASAAPPPAYHESPQRCVGEWNGGRYYERCY